MVVAQTNAGSRIAQQRASFLDQIPDLETRSKQLYEPPTQKWDRWRRSLPSWQIVAGIVVVLFASWWFWPRSSRGIYDRYFAIWEEWKLHRSDDFKDKERWERFLKHTEAELNDTVPWLEKHANATDPQSQLLLFIGRDCLRKMLKQPKQVAPAAVQQLQFLLTEARKEVRIVRLNPIPRGNAASTTDLNSDRATKSIFEPNGVHQSPTVGPTPTTSPLSKPEVRSQTRTPE